MTAWGRKTWKIRREETADLCHKQWTAAMTGVMANATVNPDGSITIRKGAVVQWAKRMKTIYVDLNLEEKEYYRRSAVAFLALFGIQED